jgi:hypothetical protein
MRSLPAVLSPLIIFELVAASHRLLNQRKAEALGVSNE